MVNIKSIGVKEAILVTTSDEHLPIGPITPAEPGYLLINEYRIDAIIFGQHYYKKLYMPTNWPFNENFYFSRYPLLINIFSQIHNLLTIDCRIKFIVDDPKYIRLFLCMSHILEMDYEIVILFSPNRVSILDYSFYTQAKRIYFSCDRVKSNFTKKTICPIPRVEEYYSTSKASSPDSTQTYKKNLLLVAYFAGPCRAVGVFRVNYWLETIAELSNNSWNVEIATAIDWKDCSEKVHFIPDKNYTSLLPTIHSSEKTVRIWKHKFREIEKYIARSVSTLGYYWRYELERYFDEHPEHTYDAVIISGNPYSYFEFSAYAKRSWSAKVLLDYRDPFANNSRIQYSDEARKHARYIEQGYNYQADCILTVNEECIALTENIDDIPVEVIKNGYDERKLLHVGKKDFRESGIHFVYAGTAFRLISLKPIIENMTYGQHYFHHVGKFECREDEIEIGKLDSYIHHGHCSYEETMGIIGASHCGIVCISGKGFESTTKVYDYLAMGLDILICTNGKLNQGTLEKELEEWPRVFWCRNQSEDISRFINHYIPSSSRCDKDSTFYSRRHSTEKLVEVLDLIVND